MGAGSGQAQRVRPRSRSTVRRDRATQQPGRPGKIVPSDCITKPHQDKAESFNAADLDISNGVQILEWYPEFASEDDYIDALMSNGDDIGVWEDGDNW